ncbi:uncharacterized protein LOC108907186 [Anoplophora glabripennis]|uniref:uncharacterized protein LOC108907186 n=1 Tax=Anoplophora glabripennis TaxID=217634 RepID=UPI0008751FC0|nr:uncharacterized protein LOC108907186 [Anoplophora glabripennis]
MFIFIVINLLLHKIHGAPTEFINNENLLTKEVFYGESVLLKCKSNVDKYNFEFWLFDKRKIVIGPSNLHDRLKYRYEILTGNLIVRAVTKNDEGLYSCVSKEVHGGNMKVENVKIVILQNWEQIDEHASSINVIRILVASIVLVLLGAGAYVLYSIWRDRYRYPRYLEQSEDEDEDEDSAEEIFTAPSTSAASQSRNKPEKKTSFDNISTDFTSILDASNDS